MNGLNCSGTGSGETRIFVGGLVVGPRRAYTHTHIIHTRQCTTANHRFNYFAQGKPHRQDKISTFFLSFFLIFKIVCVFHRFA